MCVCVDAAMYEYLCLFVLKELDLRDTNKKKAKKKSKTGDIQEIWGLLRHM